jgi:hypothetical protein
MNEFNSLERRAGLLTTQGMQQATIHTAMFMQLLAAQQAGNEKLVNFYAQRFPPDVRKAYDAWLAQKPFENPKADPHLSCLTSTKCGERAKPPKRPQKLQRACSKRATAAMFPVNISRTLFCSPQCFSSQCLGKVRAAPGSHHRVRLCGGGFRFRIHTDVDASAVNK